MDPTQKMYCNICIAYHSCKTTRKKCSEKILDKLDNIKPASPPISPRSLSPRSIKNLHNIDQKEMEHMDKFDLNLHIFHPGL